MNDYNFMSRLPFERIKEIEAQANYVLDSVYGSLDNITPPITFGRMLERANAKAFYARFSQTDVAGQLIKNEEGAGYEIIINRFDPPARQRFTVAHEIGHIELHPHKTKEIYRRNDNENYTKEEKEEETEADYFASFLLVPGPVLKQVLRLTKNLEELATIFGVSKQSMEIRLKNFYKEVY